MGFPCARPFNCVRGAPGLSPGFGRQRLHPGLPASPPRPGPALAYPAHRSTRRDHAHAVMVATAMCSAAVVAPRAAVKAQAGVRPLPAARCVPGALREALGRVHGRTLPRLHLRGVHRPPLPPPAPLQARCPHLRGCAAVGEAPEAQQQRPAGDRLHGGGAGGGGHRPDLRRRRRDGWHHPDREWWQRRPGRVLGRAGRVLPAVRRAGRGGRCAGRRAPGRPGGRAPPSVRIYTQPPCMAWSAGKQPCRPLEVPPDAQRGGYYHAHTAGAHLPVAALRLAPRQRWASPAPVTEWAAVQLGPAAPAKRTASAVAPRTVFRPRYTCPS